MSVLTIEVEGFAGGLSLILTIKLYEEVLT